MRYFKFSNYLPALWLARLTAAFAPLFFAGWQMIKHCAVVGKMLLAVFTVTYVLLALYLFFYSRTRRYTLHKGKLIFIRGLFFRRTTVIPLLSLMLLTRLETPLSRLLGLCSVILRGGRLLLVMDGLTEEQARAISDAIGATE